MIDFDLINSKVDNSLPMMSISQVLSMLSKPFDQEGVAQKTYNKHYNNPESQYYHKSIEEIMKMWTDKGAESCHYGSMLDDYIGLNLNKASNNDILLWKLDNDYDGDARLKNVCESFDNFYNFTNENSDLEFVAREQTVYLKVGEGYIKGRFDALFKSEKLGKWVIIDWKSSGSVDKENHWEKLLGPMKSYDACNGNTYSLQGYFYKTALVESGYLPEGTSFDDVEFRIVQLPGKVLSNGKNYEVHKPNFKYDHDLLIRVCQFAQLKKQMQG